MCPKFSISKLQLFMRRSEVFWDCDRSWIAEGEMKERRKALSLLHESVAIISLNLINLNNFSKRL